MDVWLYHELPAGAVDINFKFDYVQMNYYQIIHGTSYDSYQMGGSGVFEDGMVGMTIIVYHDDWSKTHTSITNRTLVVTLDFLTSEFRDLDTAFSCYVSMVLGYGEHVLIDHYDEYVEFFKEEYDSPPPLPPFIPPPASPPPCPSPPY